MRDEDDVGIGRDHLLFKLAAQARRHHRVVQGRIDVDDEVLLFPLDAEAIRSHAQPLDHVSRRHHSPPDRPPRVLVKFGTFLLYHLSFYFIQL